MPTYEYECQACGHKFEEFHSMSAEPIRKCPECKKLKVRRLPGIGAGVIFKGSGFYQTDYRSDSYNKARANDKPADSTSSSTDSPKSDSSPTARTTTAEKPKPAAEKTSSVKPAKKK